MNDKEWYEMWGFAKKKQRIAAEEQLKAEQRWQQRQQAEFAKSYYYFILQSERRNSYSGIEPMIVRITNLSLEKGREIVENLNNGCLQIIEITVSYSLASAICEEYGVWLQSFRKTSCEGNRAVEVVEQYEKQIEREEFVKNYFIIPAQRMDYDVYNTKSSTIRYLTGLPNYKSCEINNNLKKGCPQIIEIKVPEEQARERCAKAGIMLLQPLQNLEECKAQVAQYKKQIEKFQNQEKQEQQQREQERQYKESILALYNVLKYKEYLDTYEYFMSDSQCKLAIGNFVKQNSKTIENIVMGNKYDDIFNETVAMLAKVLIEIIALDFSIANLVAHKAIIATLLDEWIANFKEKNNGFCEEIKIADRNERIKLFTNSFDKAKTPQKTVYSFFLLLSNVKIDFNSDISSLHKEYKEFESQLYRVYDTIQENAVYANFKSALFTHIDTNEGGESFTIDDIDLMDGKEFEQYIATLFTKMGYVTEITKHSGDQGIDVIAKKGNKSIGIQAKCYSGTVGNSAVQEVASGKAYYKVDKVMVITNNEFTPAAKELAQANNVVLWDRNILKEKVSQYQN